MDIIELLERRDELGLSLLKEKYADYCYGIIFRLLEDRELSEEALSDVWLAIWNAIPPTRPARLRPYLAKTARNIAVDYIKHERAQKRDGMTVLLDELAECVSAPGTPEETVMVEELGTAIDRFLAAQSRRDRSVFLCRYYFAETTSEIAARYSLRESNVLVILSRMRKKLKKFLKQEGYLI